MFLHVNVEIIPRLVSVTVQAYDALRNYIDSTSYESEALASARAHAEDFGWSVTADRLLQVYGDAVAERRNAPLEVAR